MAKTRKSDDKQLKVFISNRESKCDECGEKLGHHAVMMQLPIGLEADFEVVVDLITMKANYFEGDNGEKVTEAEIPENMQADAETAREAMQELARKKSLLVMILFVFDTECTPRLTGSHG